VIDSQMIFCCSRLNQL